MKDQTQMSTHTSGPWHTEKHNGRYEIWPKSKPPHTYVCIAQTDADAKLIAAAPDLLEACKIALECLDYERRFVDTSEWANMPGHGQSQNALRAAIAKATGESVLT